MADIAAVVIQTLQWVGAPVTRQFQYLCCFTRNITSLRNEANRLEGTTQDLQRKVDTAKNDLRVISSGVEIWLQNSNDIENETRGILDEVSNVESGCFKLGARFFLSRRAKKTTDRVKELRGRCEFDADAISQPAPPPATKAVPLSKTYNFDSRKSIEENIMITLRGEDVNMVGICGMGGLGKTTMAKRIMNRALEEHVLEEVVMAVVSRPIDKLKIQLEIGGSLGLKIEGESSQARVQKLHTRLSGPKRILLVLDDVWQRFQLEDLGIPCDSKGCTILVTSRNRDVLSAMNVEKIFGMEVLSKEDSWFLFKERAGICVDDTKLNSIAKDIVTECAGLPIALTTVGAMLKDDMDVYIWKDALRQLKQCNPDIPDFIANVYNPLKLSYDFLGSNHKYVFLLCCVYPEDADIPLEQLTYFCMGLRIATGNVDEARNRIRALTKVLKNRSLLLDSEKGDEYVRMHDVVRDVCVFIAKHEGYINIGDNDLTSSLQRYKLHSGFELLQIRNSDEEINFDGINSDLYVLSIESCSQLTSLPFTQRPINLITLVLDSCEGLETLSVVGELVNLEILICRDCDSIEELPPEIKGLNRLKVLDLSWCGNLKRIGRGITSSLVELGECENSGRYIESMKKVVTSSMDKGGATVFPSIEHLDLFSLPKLEEICDDRISSNSFQNLRELKLINLPVLKQLWMSSQNDLGKDFLPQLEVLYILNCGMETVFLWKGEDGNENTSCHHITKIFPKLKELRLFDLPNLISLCQGIEGIEFPLMRKIKIKGCGKMKGMVWNEKISGGSSNNASIQGLFCPQQVSFSELEELKIFGCQSILSLFTSSMAGNLVNLKELSIGWCDEMVEVIKDDEEKGMSGGGQTALLFPQLQKLYLWYLPKLVSFCESKGIESIQFPVLRSMEIKECEKIIHLFCQSKQVSFSELEELKIAGCRGILSLFTSSMAGNLVNLKELEISECYEMVEVIKDDEEKGMSGGRQTALLFPKLQKLMLWKLSKLVSFCESKGIESIQFPVLREMRIWRCGKMKGMVANGVTSNENNSAGSSTNAAGIIHLFCQSKQVSFGCLKKLDSDRNPFCSHTIHVSIFDRLEVLYIFHYKGSMSLFSSSITGNLVNLTTLTISRSYNMVKVIEEKEEEKEKVVSGAQRTTILFPKLHKIELSYLPKLVRFCEWKCDVELPSLTELIIYGCRNMKSCTAGLLTTPNLKSVKIEDEEFGDVKDLNGLVQQQYLRRAEEEEEEEKRKRKRKWKMMMT